MDYKSIKLFKQSFPLFLSIGANTKTVGIAQFYPYSIKIYVFWRKWLKISFSMPLTLYMSSEKKDSKHLVNDNQTKKGYNLFYSSFFLNKTECNNYYK